MNPQTTIYLCQVDFDSTQKNQVTFFEYEGATARKNAQFNYFYARRKKPYEDYLKIRKSLPEGGTETRVRVEGDVDSLRALGVNYIMWQNAFYGNKWFYGFITDLIYINDGTTELKVECDVFQTWIYDVEIMDSYVVREHAEYDDIGDNLIPESFDFQDYDYRKIYDTGSSELKEWGYLLATSQDRTGRKHSGIYQGLSFYYYTSVDSLNEKIDSLLESDGDCIEFITVIPTWSVSHDVGLLPASSYPTNTQININYYSGDNTFEGYNPQNKKLHTYPYTSLVVTNHSGDEAVYKIEGFDDRSEMIFDMYGDISANPCITLIPATYNNTFNPDFGISISGFPQCSFVNDTFKLWLAKNQYSLKMDTLSGVGQIVAGVSTALASGGVGLAVGGGMAVSGVTQIANTMNSVYQAEREPNKTSAGATRNNLLTAMKQNSFAFYKRRIKRQYAEMVDSFFTMYGYQTNAVKKPNLDSRPYFNYVQTIDINIRGGIPADDMAKLKSIFNNGVTLWREEAIIGNYDVINYAKYTE